MEGMKQMHLFTSNFKRLLKIIAVFMLSFCAILGMLLFVFTKTWRPKENLYYFYQLDKNSLDVINIGSSHVHSSINTVWMYQQQGISSYNLSAGSQAIWYSYYYLKEALKTQDPQVIMLDVYTLANTNDAEYIDKAQLNLLTMKPSWDKWQALQASGADDIIGLLLGFPKNHARYRELTSKEYDDKVCLNMMGYAYSGNTEPLQNDSVLNTIHISGAAPISEKAEFYLRKMIELCQEKNIGIVLVNAPWPYIQEEDAERYNYIRQIAEEYGIDFIDGCDLSEQIGMDYRTDNAGDNGHLNYSGSQKWTKYLMQYLLKNYELPDRRLEHPLIWEESIRQLNNMIVRDHLQNTDNAYEYLNCLLDKSEYAYAVIVNSTSPLPDRMEQLLEKVGLDMREAQKGYLLRMPNGQIYSGVDFASDTKMFSDMYDKISNYREKDEEYHFLQMQFNGRIGEERTEEDIYFIVFDPFRNSALDTAEFRESNGYER